MCCIFLPNARLPSSAFVTTSRSVDRRAGSADGLVVILCGRGGVWGCSGVDGCCCCCRRRRRVSVSFAFLYRVASSVCFPGWWTGEGVSKFLPSFFISLFLYLPLFASFLRNGPIVLPTDPSIKPFVGIHHLARTLHLLYPFPSTHHDEPICSRICHDARHRPSGGCLCSHPGHWTPCLCQQQSKGW